MAMAGIISAEQPETQVCCDLNVETVSFAISYLLMTDTVTPSHVTPTILSHDTGYMIHIVLIHGTSHTLVVLIVYHKT